MEMSLRKVFEEKYVSGNHQIYYEVQHIVPQEKGRKCNSRTPLSLCKQANKKEHLYSCFVLSGFYIVWRCYIRSYLPLAKELPTYI